MKHLFAICAVLLIFNISAQTAPTLPGKIGTVTGKIIDNALKQPVPYATVIIKSKADNATLTGGITADDGTFELKDISEGTHLFEVQSIGYKIYRIDITISSDKRKLDLGTIALEENIEELEGVDVVGERTTIEQRIDRKVINVGKDLTTAGATASDIMNNIPSVSVDQQTGNISLRGNENVRVMVDGKLSNVPIAQLLKQIPSTSIKSIELITNPSAKYNPEGMSGIINIVLQKNANIGFNGNVNVGLTYQEEAKFNTSVDMNYRHGKVNLYGSIGNNVGNYLNDGHIYRFVDNTEQFFDFNNNNKSTLFKAGIDFYLNEKNTISFFTNQNIFDGKNIGNTSVVYYNNTSRNSGQINNTESSNWSQQYNFDYKLDFTKEGHNIELEVDYNTFSNEEESTFINFGASTIPNYEDFPNTDRDQTTVNLDYVNPLNEKSKLELGAEARLFETDVDYKSTGFSYNSNGVYGPTPDTQFIYKMDIYSGYATFGQNFEKWGYQIGARVENVEVKADTNSVRAFTDKYIQVYPSAFITYTPQEENQYQLSVSRRVDRPGLGQVNPIREWSSPLLSTYGNPNLVPQFTNSIEANYTRRLKKGSVTAGVFYRNIQDEINRVVYVDRLDLNKQVVTYDNFENTTAYGIELSSNYRPAKWWNFNTGFDMFSQTQRGLSESIDITILNPVEDDIISQKVEVDNLIWNVRMSNNFTLTKKLTFSLFGLYRGASKGIQFETKPMYFVNTGLRHSFADGKGSISLNYNDIFNTMQFAFEVDNPYRQDGDFNWESQTVYIGMSYRFGSGKDKALSRKRRDDNTKEGGGSGIL